ncbi:MAG: hypothetical protein IPL16_01075 [Ignavibacteria bacterium]|nr:hypothetical protein [Ignavibacteria bacterium]
MKQRKTIRTHGVYGVAPYKITNKEALDQMDYLQGQFGVRKQTFKPAFTKRRFHKLEKEFDAVL